VQPVGQTGAALCVPSRAKAMRARAAYLTLIRRARFAADGKPCAISRNSVARSRVNRRRDTRPTAEPMSSEGVGTRRADRARMNSNVRDVMNPQLVYLPEGTRPDVARKYILDFKITAVPVLDSEHKPVGVVSLRDLVDSRVTETCVTEPARTIGADEPILSAARALAEYDVHHLVVVGQDGRAVGMVSALDIVRGLICAPPKHPRTIDEFVRQPHVAG
jgi:CBS domain-containing protein